MPSQRAELAEAVGAGAEVGAQDGDDPPVGDRRALRRTCLEHPSVGVLGHRAHEVRLADAGVAGDEQHRSLTELGLVQGLRKLRALDLPPDERAARGHGHESTSVLPRGGQDQLATGAGSGRTITVSATGMISSAGRPDASACARIASGLSPS